MPLDEVFGTLLFVFVAGFMSGLLAAATVAVLGQ